MSGALDGFTSERVTFDGETRTVYRRGSGPAVIVMSEIPGITPNVARFATWVAERGMTAVVPHLFGVDGAEPTAANALSTFLRGCVSREFVVLARGRTSPIVSWLRQLARAEHERCGGPGVGAVGMCFTGGFALGMMVEDAVIAPVLSQPSLPIPVSRANKRDLGVSAADLARIRERADDGVCVLGLRFTGDAMAPGERFDRLREELGDRFIGVELDSSPGNPHGHHPRSHSVLTEHLRDAEGTPTRRALDQVLDFFAERLLVP